MGYVRRLTAVIGGRLDGALSRIENHDALVTGMIRDLSQANARARANLARVTRDGDALEAERDEASTQADKWRIRARRFRDEESEPNTESGRLNTSNTDSNRGKALECLRRAKSADAQLQTVTPKLAVHRRLEDKLATELKANEVRVSDLKRKLNALRTQDAHHVAAGTIGNLSGSVESVEDAMIRWEAKVSAYDQMTAAYDDAPTIDPFASELDQAEYDIALEAELAGL